MDKRVESLIRNWQKRNILGLYCEDKDEAADKVLGLIPKSASIGFSGSQTLEQAGIIKRLEARKNKIFDPYLASLSREESLKVRKDATLADFYLASPNAISEKGEMVFFSGYGNRTSGVSYAKSVILVVGINKIVPTMEEALRRAREYATPLNCKRLNWEGACLKDGICRKEICFAPLYKRMCCQILIIEAEAAENRLRVVLVGENLGF